MTRHDQKEGLVAIMVMLAGVVVFVGVSVCFEALNRVHRQNRAAATELQKRADALSPPDEPAAR